MKAARGIFLFFLILVVVLLAGGIWFYQRPVSWFNHLLYFQMERAGAESHFVTVNGIRMHYYTVGPKHGAPVLLIHGLGGHAEDWRNLMPYLFRSGFRIYAPDLPGYGRSDRPQNSSYSIHDEAAAVIAFMDAVGLKKVDLGGWSMGGWIVQRIAFQYPERVNKLMLFDSAGLYIAPTWNTNLFTPATQVELDQLDKLLMPHPPQTPGFIVRDILRESRQNAWIIHRAMDSMLTGKDATDAILPQLKMPVLIVWGSVDQITPLSEGETMHRLIPQSQLEVAENCGHLAPVQCTEILGPGVAAFLK